MKSEFLKLLGGFGWFSYMAEEWGWCEEGWGRGAGKKQATHQQSMWQGTTHEHLSKEKIKI